MEYHCVMQRNTFDCGAACISTISNYYGIQVSIDKVCKLAESDSTGITASGLVKAAEMIGFNAKAVKGERDGLFTPFPLPCIAHMEVHGFASHYVVIHEISEGEIIIADPAEGIVRLSPSAFFGEIPNCEVQRYKWSGVLILIVPV